MSIHDVLHEPQAEPGTPLLPHPAVRTTEKTFKQAAPLLRPDPDPAIVNGDQNAMSAASRVPGEVDGEVRSSLEYLIALTMRLITA